MNIKDKIKKILKHMSSLKHSDLVGMYGESHNEIEAVLKDALKL